MDAIQGAEPLVHTKCYLVKLHGDYKDTRIRNTNNELSKYDCKFNKLLARIFDDYGLIVCGWSGEWDRALHQAIMRNPSRRYSFFWAHRGEISDSKNSIANKIVQHRRGSSIPIVDADDFFAKLRDRVQTLAQTRRQDPANVDLLVNMTKRFAAKPEHRIELNDLLDSEIKRLLYRVSHYTSQSDSDVSFFIELVNFYESSTETLGCMFGVLGRWGDSAAHDAVVNAIFHLLSQHREMQFPIKPGIQIKTEDMCYYPAILLIWTYGIGLTVANRLEDLHGLLSHLIPSFMYHDDKKRLIYFIVEDFLLKVNSYWEWISYLESRPNHKKIFNLESSKTPFSDHLFKNVFDKWRKKFAPILADFNDLYDNWEILLVLTFYEEQDKIKFLPLSRRAWLHNYYFSHKLICNKIMNYAFRQELIKAGFADGNKESLAKIIDEYKQIYASIRS